MLRYWIAPITVVVGLSLSTAAFSNEPGWVGNVVMPQPERSVIERTPIVDRPYRPLHFYGNTVRRLHYHGRALPTPAEFGRGMGAFVTRRTGRR